MENYPQLKETLFKLDLSVPLSELSDEKLKETAIEIFNEAFKRSETLALDFATIIEKVTDEYSQNDIIDAQRRLEEQERKTKQIDDAKKEAELQKKRWLKKKSQSQKLIDLLAYEHLYVQVWSKDGSGLIDRRVYLKTGDYFNGHDVACYYLHGNSKNPPKTITLYKHNKMKTDYSKEDLKTILHEIAESWTGVKFETAQAIEYSE